MALLFFEALVFGIILIAILWQNKFRVNPTKGVLFLVLLAIAMIIGSKLYKLQERGPNIGVELVGPAHLNVLGREISTALQSNHRIDAVLCVPKGVECDDVEQLRVSSFITTLWDFAHGEPSKAMSVLDWITSNDLSMSANALYRGRFLHHYSTVIWPYYYAERAGTWTLVAAQYGAVLPLQLFVFSHAPFYLPALISWIALSLIGLGVLAIYIIACPRRNQMAVMVALAIAAILAISANTGAIAISPGFNPLRYLPTSLMVYVFLYHRTSRTLFVLLFVPAVLLNSLQFNSLFACLLLVTLVARFLSMANWSPHNPHLRVVGKSDAAVTFGYTMFVGIISLLQLSIASHISSDFPFSLSGSLNESSRWNASTVLWHGLLLNLASIVALAIVIKLKIKNYLLEIDAIVLCVGFSHYATSFYGSPQHFCGFILMVAPAIVFVNSSLASHSRVYPAITVASLALFVVFYGYWSVAQTLESPVPNLYSEREIGEPLYFETATDAERIASEISQLANNVELESGHYYLLIREKLLLELLLQEPIGPNNYDPFSNLLALNETNVLQYTKSAQYIVTYSPGYIDNFKRLLTYSAGNLVDFYESKQMRKLLTHQAKLMSVLATLPHKCSERFCVYDRGVSRGN